MNRFLFILKNTICSLKEHLGFNLIIVVALAIGLFMPVLFLAQGNYYLNFCRHSFYTDAEGTAFIDGMRKYKPEIEMNESLSKLEGVTDFAYYASLDVTIERETALFLSRAVGISEHYADLTKHTLLDGRFLTAEEIKNNENVCVVVRSSQYTDGWIVKAGDRFNMNGREYTVVGTVLDPKAYGTFLVPYGTLEEMVRPNSELQYMMFLRTVPDNIENTLDTVASKKLMSTILQSFSAAEHENEYRHQLRIAFQKILLPQAVLLAFSVVNFILVIYGKFLENQYAWGVKIAMGETSGTIFAEIFLQNLILILLAVFPPAIIIGAIIPKITTINMLINGMWALGVGALCLILALIITVVLYIALRKKNVLEMLKVK